MLTMEEEKMVMGRDLVKSFKGSVGSLCIEEGRALKVRLWFVVWGFFRAGMFNESETDVLKHALISERHQ